MSNYSATIIADTPVAYYRLDELTGTVVNDSSGNGLNGSLTSTPTGVTIAEPGLIITDSTDDCYLFTLGGVNGVQIVNNALFNVADVFSLEAWFQLNSLGNTTAIFSLGGNAGFIRVNSNNTFHLLKSQIADMVGSTVSLTTSTTYHGVATKNGSTIHLYINGADVTGSVSNATCANSTNSKSIGGTDAGFATGFPGFIDEVAIYNYALSPTQVSAHYTAGTVSNIPVTPPRLPINIPRTEAGTRIQAGSRILAPARSLS